VAHTRLPARRGLSPPQLAMAGPVASAATELDVLTCWKIYITEHSNKHLPHVQPGWAARVHAQAGGREHAIDQHGVHPTSSSSPSVASGNARCRRAHCSPRRSSTVNEAGSGKGRPREGQGAGLASLWTWPWGSSWPLQQLRGDHGCNRTDQIIRAQV
jgi:hypothetical protein